MKRFGFLLFAVVALSPLAGEELAWRELPSGLGVLSIIETEPEAQSFHAVRVPRRAAHLRLEALSGFGRVLGLQTIPEMTQPRRLPFKGAIEAAVNGDFFLIREDSNYTGVTRGLQISGGEIVACPEDGTAYPFTGRTVSFLARGGGTPDGIAFAAVTPKLRARFPDGAELSFGINGCYPPGKAMLYTPRLGLPPDGAADPRYYLTTRTEGVTELRLLPPAGVPFLRFGDRVAMSLKEINPHGNGRIVAGEYLLALPPEWAAKAAGLKAGDRIEFSFDSEPSLAGVHTAISGHTHVVTGGKAVLGTVERRSRAPRTAYGYDDDYLYLVVADGRKPKVAEGLTYDELAALMVRIGAREAVAFDGGGSSMLYVRRRLVNLLYTRPNLRRLSSVLAVVNTQDETK